MVPVQSEANSPAQARLVGSKIQPFAHLAKNPLQLRATAVAAIPPPKPDSITVRASSSVTKGATSKLVVQTPCSTDLFVAPLVTELFALTVLLFKQDHKQQQSKGISCCSCSNSAAPRCCCSCYQALSKASINK